MEVDRNAPATKGDIADLRAEMKGDIADLRAEMKAMEDRLIEAFRDAQTELLKAFYSFTGSNHQRLSQVEGNESAVIARLGTLENRVTDLERKMIPPPF